MGRDYFHTSSYHELLKICLSQHNKHIKQLQISLILDLIARETLTSSYLHVSHAINTSPRSEILRLRLRILVLSHLYEYITWRLKSKRTSHKLEDAVSQYIFDNTYCYSRIPERYGSQVRILEISLHYQES